MRLFHSPLSLPETTEESQRGINMVDLMMWLVIAALLLAAAIQSIGYYQQASLTYQAKSDLAGAHSWAAARTSLDTKAPTSTEMTAALLSGDLKLTNNGGITNIGVIATTGDKYCLGVKAPGVKGSNVFYSTSDSPNTVMSDVSLPAFCGTATEVTTTGTTTVETPSTATATSTASSTSTATATPTPTPTFTTVNWAATTQTTTTNIYKGAGSADLSRLLAGGNGTIQNYLSNDGGNSWSQPFPNSTSYHFNAVAVSASGTAMLAGGSGNGGFGSSYVSTNGGANWTAVLGNGSWESMSVSADGTTMLACDNGAYPATWVSTTSGSTWTKTTMTGAASASAMSADGKTIYAGGNFGLVYSTDSGATWKNKSFGQTAGTYVSSIVMTPDGTKVVIGSNASTSAGIYISTDSGATFTKKVVGTHSAGIGVWQSVGISSDGTKIIAGDSYNNELYFSLDSGGTWTKVTSLPAYSWRTTLVSADGKKYVAMGSTGKVYTGALG